ncbi:hypothetical protein CH267_06890 [Rhodococcus sp. 06-621-2]|nr:hypothetical protein [Rhodococcus sp. 06-621-2]OZC59804.1 hypothetical protein CH267_06890 [Rhodococcus sp. 06-621-2]
MYWFPSTSRWLRGLDLARTSWRSVPDLASAGSGTDPRSTLLLDSRFPGEVEIGTTPHQSGVRSAAGHTYGQ